MMNKNDETVIEHMPSLCALRIGAAIATLVVVAACSGDDTEQPTGGTGGATSDAAADGPRGDGQAPDAARGGSPGTGGTAGIGGLAAGDGSIGGNLDSSAGAGGAINQEGGLGGYADDAPLDCSDIDGATGDSSIDGATGDGSRGGDGSTDGDGSTGDSGPADGSFDGGDGNQSGGLPVVNGYYAQKASDGGIVYGGYLHTDTFGSNATVTPMCTGGPGCLNDNFCVSGTVPSGYSYGAVAMWNLNQAAIQDGALPDAAPPSTLPADLTGKTRIVIRISGNYGMHPYVGLSADSNSYYTQIPTGDGGTDGDLITIPFTSLSGYAYVDGGFVPIAYSTDKHPIYVYIQMFTDLVQTYSFNFCVTQLSIE